MYEDKVLEGKRLEIVLSQVEVQKLYRLKQLINSGLDGFQFSTSQVVGEAIRELLSIIENKR